MIILGAIIHAIFFGLLMLTDLGWMWSLIISSAVVWFGVTIISIDGTE